MPFYMRFDQSSPLAYTLPFTTELDWQLSCYMIAD